MLHGTQVQPARGALALRQAGAEQPLCREQLALAEKRDAGR
jgi:hypothetical protein